MSLQKWTWRVFFWKQFPNQLPRVVLTGMLTSQSPGELDFAQFLERKMSGPVTPKWGSSSLLELTTSCSWHFFKSARRPVVRSGGCPSLAAPWKLWSSHLLLKVSGGWCSTSREGGFPCSLWFTVLLCPFTEYRNQSVCVLPMLLCRSNDNQHSPITGSECRVAGEL